MAVADTPNPPEAIPWRMSQAEREIRDLRENKANRTDVELIRADIRDIKDGIRNWSIAMFGGSAVIVAGIAAIVHPHIP